MFKSLIDTTTALLFVARGCDERMALLRAAYHGNADYARTLLLMRRHTERMRRNFGL